MCGRKSKNILLLLVLFLGLSVPLFGEVAGSGEITLTETDWTILTNELGGLKSDLNELEIINQSLSQQLTSNEQSLTSNEQSLTNLERINESLRVALMNNGTYLREQEAEWIEWKNSSIALSEKIVREETLKNRWKTATYVTGGVAAAGIITIAVLLLAPSF